MLKINVYNIKGEQVGTEELNESVFGAEYKESLIHDMVVAFNANNRQGTKGTTYRFYDHGENLRTDRRIL